MEEKVILDEALWQLARLVLGERMEPEEVAAFLEDVQASPTFGTLGAEIQEKIGKAVAL